MPKAASGGRNYLLLQYFEADGSRSTRTFSTTDTATLRGLLDALIATID